MARYEFVLFIALIKGRGLQTRKVHQTIEFIPSELWRTGGVDRLGISCTWGLCGGMAPGSVWVEIILDDLPAGPDGTAENHAEDHAQDLEQTRGIGYAYIAIQGFSWRTQPTLFCSAICHLEQAQTAPNWSAFMWKGHLGLPIKFSPLLLLRQSQRSLLCRAFHWRSQ